MGVGKSLLEILHEDNGLAVMDLQGLIVPWSPSVYPEELLKKFYINVPDTMQDVAPVPKPVRFLLDRYGHFFAHHCGLNSEFSYTKQLLAGTVAIDESQYDGIGRQILKNHGDNHFKTLERPVLHYNAEGMTIVVVGKMPRFSFCDSGPFHFNRTGRTLYFDNCLYVYVESGRSMKPQIESLINGSNTIREGESIFLCSDLASKAEQMSGFRYKAQIMVPKALFSSN